MLVCFSVLDVPSEKDLHKVLQILESHISFLEDLTKMGGAMRSVLTQVLTNQQFYKDLSSGELVCYYVLRSFFGINHAFCTLKSHKIVWAREKGVAFIIAGDITVCDTQPQFHTGLVVVADVLPTNFPYDKAHWKHCSKECM